MESRSSLLYKVAGLADADVLSYIDLMTKYMEAMQFEPHQRKEAAEAKLNEISKIHILLHTVMPALSRCVTIDLRVSPIYEQQGRLLLFNVIVSPLETKKEHQGTRDETNPTPMISLS